MTQIHDLIRASNAAGEIRKTLLDMVAPGVSPMELEFRAIELCLEMEVIPILKGYKGYPCAICVSVNDVAIHGIPNIIPFRPGDVVSVDIAVRKEKMHADCAGTVIAGLGTSETNNLIDVTNGAFRAGFSILKPDVPINKISQAINSYVRFHEMQVFREFGGHGIGEKLHQPPFIPNYVSAKTELESLKENSVLTIEPIVAMGSSAWVVGEDGWSIRTEDRSFTAHHEDTILIKSDGVFNLTNGEIP